MNLPTIAELEAAGRANWIRHLEEEVLRAEKRLVAVKAELAEHQRREAELAERESEATNNSQATTS